MVQWQLDSSEGPSARSNHAGAWDADGRILWIHGGWSGSHGLRDLWRFDAPSRRWSLVSSSGPFLRWAHVAAWDGENLWIHGGWNSFLSFRDLWLFNVSGERWQEVSQTGGPAARHDHAASYDVEQHRLLVHAGWDGRNIFQDLWQFDTELLSWQLLSAAGPSPRYDHVSLWDKTQRRLWVHGGGNGVQGFGDLWTWNGAWALVTNNGPKLWDHVGGIGNTGLYVHGGWSSGGLWKFNLEAGCWGLQDESLARLDHVGALDMGNTSKPVLWIHGGRDADDEIHAGLWRWAATTLSCPLASDLLLTDAGHWQPEAAWIAFIAVLLLLLLLCGCGAWADGRRKLSRSELVKGPSREEQSDDIGGLASFVALMVKQVQAVKMRVLPGDLQTVMDHVQTPGLEAELGLSELIQVYNALASEMLRTGCYAFLWRWMALFMAIHPWVKACCFSFYISHSARVALLAAYVLSLEAFTSLFYLGVALHWTAPQECYVPRSLLEKILPGVWLALVLLLPIYILWLLRCPYKTDKRELNATGAFASTCIFWCVLLLYSGACVFYTAAILATIHDMELGDWLATFLAGLLQALVLTPLLAALSINVLLGIFLALQPAAAQVVFRMRQIRLPPVPPPLEPPHVSIWEHDLVDLDQIRVEPRPDPERPDERPMSSEISRREPEQLAEPHWLLCCAEPAPQHHVRLHFAAHARP